MLDGIAICSGYGLSLFTIFLRIKSIKRARMKDKKVVNDHRRLHRQGHRRRLEEGAHIRQDRLRQRHKIRGRPHNRRLGRR